MTTRRPATGGLWLIRPTYDLTVVAAISSTLLSPFERSVILVSLLPVRGKESFPISSTVLAYVREQLGWENKTVELWEGSKEGVLLFQSQKSITVEKLKVSPIVSNFFSDLCFVPHPLMDTSVMIMYQCKLYQNTVCTVQCL